MPASHSRQNQDSRKDQRIQHRSRQSPHRCLSTHQRPPHQRSHHTQSGHHRKHHAFRQNAFHQKQSHQENPRQIDPQCSHTPLQKDRPHRRSLSFFLAHNKNLPRNMLIPEHIPREVLFMMRSDYFSSVSAASSTTGASSTAGASSATGSAPFLPFFAGAAAAAASR